VDNIAVHLVVRSPGLDSSIHVEASASTKVPVVVLTFNPGIALVSGATSINPYSAANRSPALTMKFSSVQVKPEEIENWDWFEVAWGGRQRIAFHRYKFRSVAVKADCTSKHRFLLMRLGDADISFAS